VVAEMAAVTGVVVVVVVVKWKCTQSGTMYIHKEYVLQ